ncbi:flagellar biosynthesis protein FlhF [Candidatus Desantisbacteria bacterium]|nr:flagellar biosynthesis protein FlhF [Candidatus Desantisbacteria bacterium]
MMKYKTYEAETLQQAILKMTIDLGKDALLIDQRHVRYGGLFGLFGKKMVEVTAAIPMKPVIKQAPSFLPSSPSIGMSKAVNIPSQKPGIPARSNTAIASLAANRIEIKPKENLPIREIAPLAETDVVNLLQKEMREIKTKMDTMIGGTSNKMNVYPGKTGNLYMKLLQSELSEELAERLIKRIITESPGGLIDDEEFIEMRVRTHLAGLIRTAGPIQLVSGVPRVVILIGTTGVGKTTTIAKLAADFAFDKNKKVALITVDTYRIAAVEQLRAYADILSIPLEVAFSHGEFREAMTAYANYDLILVDTAGRSQKNSLQMAELKSFIDAAGYKMDVNLLLSATTKYREMIDIIENFKRINFHKIIFTKLDETVGMGTIVNVLSQIPQGVSYITAGQNVPEDIEVAEAAKLAKMII